MCDEINPSDLFPTVVVFAVEKHRMLGFDLRAMEFVREIFP